MPVALTLRRLLMAALALALMLAIVALSGISPQREKCDCGFAVTGHVAELDEVRNRKKILITVPPGADTGTKIRLRGQGGAGSGFAAGIRWAGRGMEEHSRGARLQECRSLP